MSDDYLSDWGLTTADDTLHPPVDDNPWWTETVWFAWIVPERNLVGYFYPIFRENLGVQAGGIMVYDHTAAEPWEILAYEYDWHEKLPDDLDLRDMRLANGLWLKALEPARKFAFGYDGKELTVDLVAEAISRPMVTQAAPPFNKGHIDQLCHVTGEMVLRGETIPVDCIAMRDRSWGPRQDGRQPQVGYEYGSSDARNGFLAISIGNRDGEYPVSSGFLIRDGEWAKIVSGNRECERDERGRPTVLHIDGTDTLGRTFTARGEVRSLQVLQSYPSMFCWNGLVEWEADGWHGHGEVQDVWHPRRWRAFAESLRG